MICKERTERQKDQDYVERSRYENLEKANAKGGAYAPLPPVAPCCDPLCPDGNCG